MSKRIPRFTTLLVSFAIASLASVSPASADEVSVGSCPDGYKGVVIGFSTDETGQREVRLCFKNPPPSTGD